MTAADDAHAELMRALTVERFTHLPETPPGPRRLRAAANEAAPESRRAGPRRLATLTDQARRQTA